MRLVYEIRNKLKIQSSVLTFPVAPRSVHEVEERQVWNDGCEEECEVQERVSLDQDRQGRRTAEKKQKCIMLYLRRRANGMVKGMPTTQYQKRR